MDRTLFARAAALIAFALAVGSTQLCQLGGVRRDHFRAPGWSEELAQSESLRVWRYEATLPPHVPAPAVILLHGYFASARMFERLYADELARRGFIVFVPEDISAAAFARRTAPAQARLELETAPIVALLDQVRRDPEVDTDRIGLLGHSFGASLALETGCADWAVSGTVSLSASLYAAEYVNHVCPRNLLLIHGDADRFTGERHQNILFDRATRHLQPDGRQSGDIALGDARKLVVIPGAGHLSLLWNTEARQAAIDWLLATLGAPGIPQAVTPFPAILLTLGVLALFATIELWTGSRFTPGDRRPGDCRWSIGCLLAGGAGVFLMAGLPERMADRAVAAMPRFGLEGASVFVSTLGVAALLALPFAIPASAIHIRRWWQLGRCRHLWALTLAVAIGRAAIAYCGLRVLMLGFYDPTPRLSHFVAAIVPAALAFIAFLVLAAARDAIDGAVTRSMPAVIVGSLRVAVVVLLVWGGLWPLSLRFNDLNGPTIELVPFSLALVVLVVVLTPGRRGEPVLDRALYGTIVAVLVLTTVFPQSA